MKRSESVVAASDLSGFSEQVAERAARLADSLGATGQLLHVLDHNALDAVRHWVDGGQDAVEKLRSQAAAALQEQVQRVSEKTGYSLQPVLEEGSVLDAIIGQVTADSLLVLGVRGQHALRDLFLGSTTRHSLYRRKGPVLVVKSDAGRRYQKIVVTTDFSDNALQALKRTAALFPDSELEVVYVLVDPLEHRMTYAGLDEQLIHQYYEKGREKAASDMEEFLIAAEVDADRIHSRVETGSPGRVLPELAEKLGADLVVAGKQGHTAVGDRLLGSVTQHLLQDCPVDVLIECR